MSRLSNLFERTRRERTLALFPYLTAGFPDDAACEELLVAAAASGAAGLEVGIPFSDPLADGPVIHAAGTQALDAGVKPRDVLALCAAISDRIPVLLMVYANLVLGNSEPILRSERHHGAGGRPLTVTGS